MVINQFYKDKIPDENFNDPYIIPIERFDDKYSKNH